MVALPQAVVTFFVALVVCVVTVTVSDRPAAGSHVVFVAHVTSVVVATAGGRATVVVSLVVCVVTVTAGDSAAAGSCVVFVDLSVSVVTATVGDCSAVLLPMLLCCRGHRR